MRIAKPVLMGCVGIFAMMTATAAWAQTKSFDIPSEDAVKAIPEFARQAGIQVLVPTDKLLGLKTPEVKGDLDIHAALDRLLAGTGMTIASDDGQTIALTAPSKNVRAAPETDGGEVERVVVVGSGETRSVSTLLPTNLEVLPPGASVQKSLNTLPGVMA